MPALALRARQVDRAKIAPTDDHDRARAVVGRLATILKRANARRVEQGLSPIAHVTNHTLRRTFASLMYEADAQPTDVMAAMGHKSAKLALEVYARKMARDRETGKRMDALVDWAQMGTNGNRGHLSVVGSDAGETERAA